MGELIEGLPPGPRWPRPIQTALWARKPIGFVQRCRARYGDMFTLRVVALGNLVIIFDPALIKQVFTRDHEAFHTGEANAGLTSVLGTESLLTVDDARHLNLRRMMLPPFHGESVAAYRERVAAIAAAEVERWPVGEPVALRPRFRDVALEVILHAVIGVRDEHRLARLRALVPQLLEVGQLTMWMIWKFPWLAESFLLRRHPATRARAELNRLLFEEIADHRADPAGRDDILAMLIAARDERGEPLSDQVLRDQVVTTLIAGHETTTTAMAWCFERLLRNEDALARLQREVDDGQDDAYLTAVINETLRVRPVLDSVFRKLTVPLELGGYRLPAGTIVMPSIVLAHLSDAYEDPQEFRPERLLDRAPPSYSLIPFGGGPRRCIGASFAVMEMKAVLRAVLERVELQAVDPTPEPIKRHHITLVPEHDARALVVKRRGAADETKRDATAAAPPVLEGASARASERDAGSDA